MSDHAIRFATTGGPDVLRDEPVEVGDPGRGEIRIRQTAIGVNFIDTYHRSGLYPMALPAGIGLEAAGVVEAIGPEVVDFAAGDRVGYGLGPIGAYATRRVIAADMVVPLPGLVSDEVAAAAMLKGGTTEFLVERCAKVEAGQTVLVHAAAGGVGQLLVQWLRAAGARVIATAGNADKAAIAREAGADEVILYRDDDVAAAVAGLTDGAGVDVVFDGVGKDTWAGSLKSLRRRGLLVSYGNASGPVRDVDLSILARSGSLFVTRPTMFDYYASVEERRAGFAKLFDKIVDGELVVTIGQRFALADAAAAHRALEARETTGSTILVP
jgi:NADPH2:quinone reductase